MDVELCDIIEVVCL